MRSDGKTHSVIVLCGPSSSLYLWGMHVNVCCWRWTREIALSLTTLLVITRCADLPYGLFDRSFLDCTYHGGLAVHSLEFTWGEAIPEHIGSEYRIPLVHGLHVVGSCFSCCACAYQLLFARA